MKAQSSHATDLIFAQILATENISVHWNPLADTASFDLKNRALELPVWTEASEATYNMLIGHEVSHALNTPTDKWLAAVKKVPKKYKTVYHNIINILEDIRIDKLIKVRYPGMRKWYYQAQEELDDNDFFGSIEADKSFLQRLNAFYKLRDLDKSVPFSFDERTHVTAADQTVTFEDVLTLADELFAKYKDTPQDESLSKQVILAPADGQSKGKLAAVRSIPRATYPSIKTFDYRGASGTTEAFAFVDSRRPVINAMVSEFIRHQKAAVYRKIKRSETGVLDVNRLHQYRFDENIFLNSTVVQKGKNHGVVMLMDMSGSMSQIIKNVLLHILALSLFCKKLQIPFKVFGFASGRATCPNKTPFGPVDIFEFINSDMSITTLVKVIDRTLVYPSLAQGGTPLSAALSLFCPVLTSFRLQHKLDKLHLLLLTDGVCDHRPTSGDWLYDEETMIRERVPKVNDSWHRTYAAPLYNIIRRKTGANICNFFFFNGKASAEAITTKYDFGCMDALFCVNSKQVFSNVSKGSTEEMFLVKKVASYLG
jgi:hypothetical protein